MNKQAWSFLIYRVPSQPSTQRVYVWRKLKGWGGLYLQQSVCVLPYRAELQPRLDALKNEIVNSGGEIDVFTLWIEDPEQNTSLIERFRQQSNAEYQELIGRCDAFHQELEAERTKNNFTFAELDENERELAKLQAWMEKIRERDWFEADVSVETTARLGQCGEDFQRFSEEVYQAQKL